MVVDDLVRVFNLVGRVSCLHHEREKFKAFRALYKIG